VALAVVGRAGGRAAAIFAGLADRATREAALRREQRALTAQVRASALIIGSLPIVSLPAGGWSRTRLLLDAGPGGIGLALAGLAMQALGVLLIWRKVLV
jgi:Flp pilus assembly protein TadB